MKVLNAFFTHFVPSQGFLLAYSESFERGGADGKVSVAAKVVRKERVTRATRIVDAFPDVPFCC